MRKDAAQLAHMNNSQLAQQSTLTIINDLVAQATNAFNGYNNPSTGKLEEGYSQINLQIQKLATFDVKPYSGNGQYDHAGGRTYRARTWPLGPEGKRCWRSRPRNRPARHTV